MSRTNKYNSKYNKHLDQESRLGKRVSKSKKIKEETQTNLHHCINVSSWWANNTENLIELIIKTHNELHDLFWNKLPHEIIKTLIKTIWKPFNEELKKDLLDVLRKHKGKEYKENTYHNRPKNWPNEWNLYIVNDNNGKDRI